MTEKQIILRVDATYHLKVQTGDRVHRAQSLCDSPNENGRLTAPVAGIVKSIRFDPDRHEFVIALEPTG
jgi:Na+-translocating ferredoxin:NAD+ oxidoreductase RnfC subunit